MQIKPIRSPWHNPSITRRWDHSTHQTRFHKQIGYNQYNVDN